MTSSYRYDETTGSGRVRSPEGIQAEERNVTPPAAPNVDDASDGESVISGKRPHIETSPDPESDSDSDDDPTLFVARRRRALTQMKPKYPLLTDLEEDIVDWAAVCT